MNNLQTERHMFPGGNTSKGFYSFYRYILSQEDANRIICIKGGPGTGKSSLMNKVATNFLNEGYSVEYQHCSSDNNSLDGVVIPALKVAILDGTSPHVVDPVNPGAVDEILNMGDCWNVDGFAAHKKDVIDTNKEIGKTFKRAYRFFAAAKAVHDDITTFNNAALQQAKINKLKEDLANNFFTSKVSNVGNDRHLFATAFTPNGIITYVDTLYQNYETVYVLNGDSGTGKSDILKYLAEMALSRGLNVELYHDPLIPERIEHILIPGRSLAFITSNEINEKKFEGTQIYMSDYMNTNTILRNKSEVDIDKVYFKDLINKGLTTIASAKLLHDELETYYVPNMNFDIVTDKLNYVIDTFNKYR